MLPEKLTGCQLVNKALPKTDNFKHGRHLRNADNVGWDVSLTRQHGSVTNTVQKRVSFTHHKNHYSSLLAPSVLGNGGFH